jgi:predicted metal-dependent peptidase|tara:strand:+ start:608 stop:1852 length:1245 start_codon:yes stop_codon:yes gene_type:complete
MFARELTVEQRLDKNIVAIMGKDRYVSMTQLIMIGKKEVKDGVPTAYTDGKNEVYGRAFHEQLTDPEFRFVILHENYHKAFRQITVWHHLWLIDAKLTNMAADYVINIIIIDENKDDKFAVMPKGGLYDERFRGMDVQQVFDILYKEQDGGGGEEGEEEGDSAGKEEGNGGDGPPREGEEGDFRDDHDWTAGRTVEEEEDLKVQIHEALQSGVLLAGKTGSGGNRTVEELAKPQVDWRQVMKDFAVDTMAGSDYTTYRRPNRRHYGEGYYLPSGMTDVVGEMVSAPDMSGSIGTSEQGVFLGETESLCKLVRPSKLHVMYWDTQVCQHEQYDPDQMDTFTSETTPKGGGGTRPSCLPEYIAANNLNPQCVIVLTDGHVWDWGNWTCPVLWVVVDNESAEPPMGKVVHVRSGDLR